MPESPKEIAPEKTGEQILLSPDDFSDKRYLAFPSILKTSPSKLLIAYKRGHAHAHGDDKDRGYANGNEEEAYLDLVEFDIDTNTIIASRTIDDTPGIVNQMPEIHSMPNGDIAIYAYQYQGGSTTRVGAKGYRSVDGGDSFQYEGELGVIDGIEVGYPYELINTDRSYMILATFPELEGPSSRSVHVIESEDNGTTWRHTRNLTGEFGVEDESTFREWRDGFLVVTRGYDNQARIHQTTSRFELLNESNLTARYSCIERYIGRPRLFTVEDDWFFLGRNHTSENSPKQLSLFRINPESLEIDLHALLDNKEEFHINDAYYAEPYFHSDGGETRFNIITYRDADPGKQTDLNEAPSLIRLEYDWDDIVME